MRTYTVFALALVVLVACRDGGDDDQIADAGVDAADLDGALADAALADAALADAASIDAAEVDGAVLDAAVLDAAILDGAVLDADTTDGAVLDGAVLDAAVLDGPIALGSHLLITEVKTVDNSEFIEVYNPTGQTVDLRNYYLTDHQGYYLLPGVIAGNTTQPTTDASDFLVRFPAGATLGPFEVITIAADAVGFETGLLQVPSYAIQEVGNSIPTEAVWLGVGTPNPGLTNAGEAVVLFFWDGVSDNVKDVDIVIAGNAPTAANSLVAKTPVDGPDADTSTTAYATDLLTIADMETDSPNLTSYKRIALEAGQETQLGTGNGITGDDETSESLRLTWDSQAVATGYTAATPGVVPAALNP